MLESKLESCQWKFAKTMQEHPHEYTLREWWDDDEFIEMVKHIRKNGVWGKFFYTPIKYYYANGYKYWTMGYGLDQTKLINRANAEH